MSITLTESQQKAKQDILHTINSKHLTDDDRFHTLSGGAGFGKTTVIVDIIKSIPVHLSICLTGTTHKSVKVIANMCIEKNIIDRVDTRTIHSKLGLKLVQYGTQERLQKDNFNDGYYCDVLMIDESSQLTDEVIDYILECDAKVVIFIGDEAQAEPVGSNGNISSIFKHVKKHSKLKEVMRCAADNPIIKLATKFRECQVLAHAPLPKIVTDLKDNNGIIVKDSKHFFNSLLDKYRTEEFKLNPDYCRCIAHTNNKINKSNIVGVNEINKYIREQLHGKDVSEFIVGETIIAQESNLDYNNADEFVIKSIESDYCSLYTPDPLEVWVMELYSDCTNMSYYVNVIKQSSIDSFNYRLDYLVKLAKSDKNNAAKHWCDYYELKKAYPTFKHVYCITAYKSQGSTYDHTYIYTPNFLYFGKNLSIKRLLYTSLTRSRFTTTFYKQLSTIKYN